MPRSIASPRGGERTPLLVPWGSKNQKGPEGEKAVPPAPSHVDALAHPEEGSRPPAGGSSSSRGRGFRPHAARCPSFAAHLLMPKRPACPRRAEIPGSRCGAPRRAARSPVVPGAPAVTGREPVEGGEYPPHPHAPVPWWKCTRRQRPSAASRRIGHLSRPASPRSAARPAALLQAHVRDDGGGRRPVARVTIVEALAGRRSPRGQSSTCKRPSVTRWPRPRSGRTRRRPAPASACRRSRSHPASVDSHPGRARPAGPQLSAARIPARDRTAGLPLLHRLRRRVIERWRPRRARRREGREAVRE